MRWDDLRQSSNVEDVRGSTGGGRGLKLGRGRHADCPRRLLLPRHRPASDPRAHECRAHADPGTRPPHHGTPQDEQGRFIAAVLGETEDTWSAIFQARGAQYVPPKLVLYRDQMPTACGTGSAAAGPFYCPLDRKVYLDLGFFQQLSDEFQAPGLFAEAYVLAHEVGHHVQNQLGIADKVRAAQERASEAQANQLSVRLELQADCFAGVWAKHADQTKHILEQGDVESALRAAAAVGDDTHPEALARLRRPGLLHPRQRRRAHQLVQARPRHGSIQDCDTFAAGS